MCVQLAQAFRRALWGGGCRGEPSEGALTSLLLCVAGLINTFRVFGSLSVEWPGKDGKHPRCPPKGNMPKGNSDTVGLLFSHAMLQHGCWDGTAACW